MAKDDTDESKGAAKQNSAAGAEKSDANAKDGSATAKPAETSSAQPTPTSGIEMLKADHRKVEGLFTEFDTADDNRKDELIQQICSELIIHTVLEEQIFYPACRRAADNEDKLDEAQVEHDAAKVLINDLQNAGGRDQYRDAKVKVLGEEIRHHIGEEEKPNTGVFAQAKAKGVDTPDLARQLQRLKSELQARGDRLPAARPVSFGGNTNRNLNQENSMPRNYGNDRERDDQGRFMSDDDDRGGRGGGRGQGAYRDRDDEGRFTSGRGGRDDDDRGGRGGGRGEGGWFGDSRGHSEASRRGWEERSYSARSSRDDDDRGGRGGGGGQGNYRERDDEGRFTSGRGGGGRDYDDDRGGRGGGRDRGQGGWFGDSQGHSEASRRGWDRSDHEGSGWYGDSRGHAEASRRGWERSDHEGSGWYGDPEGHSEASRRGWDERGGGRGAQARGGRDDDDRRGGRGGGGGRGRGQGGWFGDPEGHSEASRKGWDDRR